MDDTDAALLRDRDGHTRLGDGVHGGGHDGNVERDVAGKPGLRIHIGGDNVGAGGKQQHVVESKRLWNGKMDHCSSFLHEGMMFHSKGEWRRGQMGAATT